MRLNDLLREIQYTRLILPKEEVSVSGVNIDSRLVEEGGMFIAIRGTQADGHAYIPSAEEKGAKAIVCENMPEKQNPNVAYVVVPDAQAVAGRLATTFYGNPSQRLRLVGVTGTNGKTTIATLLYDLFREMGHKCGLLSTVCNYIDGKAYPSTHTTPDAISLNRLLAQMVEAGCEYAFMEVSSHALAQERVGGLEFAGAIFTNLTRDHMDFHETMENYLKAKKSFFDNLPRNAFAITNLDDKNGPVMGKDPEEVLRVMSTLRPVSGRFETLHSADGISAIVDYAHTPDALKNVLGTINEVLRGKGNIITVVGAGGNRDKGKRPIMATEAVKGSNRVILTSDNPRFEEPQDIINDMLAGLSDEQKKNVISIVDRKEAIRTACALAQKGDVILVAGKGHEDYQDVKGVKHHFDDKEIIREIFNA